MSEFSFATDEKSRSFCLGIIAAMVEMFDIPEKEALGRINETWSGLEIIGEDVIYHEEVDYWANHIYYGKDSFWWLDPPGLEPLPYPQS